jgi:hypothetical protein
MLIIYYAYRYSFDFSLVPVVILVFPFLFAKKAIPTKQLFFNKRNIIHATKALGYY